MANVNWNDLPKVDFGIWPNQFKVSSKHPTKTGSIEISEKLLKGMLERAKAGEMPILSVAIWPRTSLNGQEYENAQAQLKPSKTAVSEFKREPEPEVELEVEEDNESFNWG